MSSPTSTGVTTLIIGASGKTGRRVAQKLAQRGISFRGVSRSSTPAFDWQTPENWATVLKGIREVYISYAPDLAMPQAPEHIRQFCHAARKSGVEKIVLLSGRGEPAAQHCETIVQQSGLLWTVIRASWFIQNFTEGAFAPMIAEGVIALPDSGIKEPFIDIEDIADIAVKALTSGTLNNRLFEVTGPQSLTFAELAEQFSEKSADTIRYIPLTMAQFTRQLREQQTPEDTIQMLEYLFGEVLDGRNARTSSGVEQALERPATDILTTLRREIRQTANSAG